MDIFTDARQKVQYAIGHDEVVSIHPLDMAELLMERSGNDPLDIIRTSAVDDGDTKEYVVIGDTVYHQTVSTVRTGSAIN
jgi:hypothetical protein